MANERPQTVVDYDAWKRGYMPPSEHVLIDKLAYRGARVQLSTPISREHQIWVVIDGPPLTNKQRKAIRDMVNLWFEDEAENGAPDAERVPAANRTAEGEDITPSPSQPQTDTGSVT